MSLLSSDSSYPVTFIIDSLGAGGSERSLVELLPFYVRDGIDPVVISLEGTKNGFEEDVRDQGVDLYILDGLSPLQQLWATRRFLAEKKPALLHTTLYKANLIGRFAALGTGIPVLTSLVNTSYEDFRINNDPNLTPWKVEVVRIIDQTTSLLNTHFHAVAHTVKASAIEKLGIPPEKITVVERGRPSSTFTPPSQEERTQIRSQYGLDGEFLLLSVGRHEYQKNQIVMLKAMAHIAQSHPNVCLWIAGKEGNATSALREAICDMNLEGRVKLLGFRDDVHRLLSAADLFVFPSISEGLSGAVVEALAMQLPVICADIPALREIVEEGGNALTAPPHNHEILSRHIQTLVADKDRLRAFGARSREIFEHRFTIESTSRRMINMYSRVWNRS